MDPLTSFTQRLSTTWPYLFGVFFTGFLIALWDPNPGLIVTVALGISAGMLVLGPYSSAVLYSTRLQHIWRGHLRWPLLLLLATTSVLILDYFVSWPLHQLALTLAAAVGGTIVGHDATLAMLELRTLGRGYLDGWMAVLFPIILGLTVLSGYCSLGFGLGTYHLIVALAG